MSETVIATDGTQLPIDDLAQTLTYTTISSNQYVQSISVSYKSNTYKQTFTYTGTNVTGISQWVKQ